MVDYCLPDGGMSIDFEFRSLLLPFGVLLPKLGLALMLKQPLHERKPSFLLLLHDVCARLQMG